jgi:hypothetical protein
MERMFLDPETGNIYPESYYRHENIDLATVIETVRHGDNELGFVIIPENVSRMRVRNDVVFEVFKEFLMGIAHRFETTEDEEEREELREVGYMISQSMVRNCREIEAEENRTNLH